MCRRQDGWLSSNRLKFNADQTEFVWLGTRQQLLKVTHQSLVVNGVGVAPVSKVRNWRRTNNVSSCQPSHQWLFLPASAVAKYPVFPAVRCPASTCDCIHRKLAGLLYCHIVWSRCRQYTLATGRDECCCSTGYGHWQILWVHYTRSLRHSTLAASPTADYLQDYCARLQLHLWYWSCIPQWCLHAIGRHSWAFQSVRCWSWRPSSAITSVLLIDFCVWSGK